MNAKMEKVQPKSDVKKPSLAELLARSMEDDAVDFDPPTINDRERWDEDEGSSGG
jgi:hypothetical protein